MYNIGRASICDALFFLSPCAKCPLDREFTGVSSHLDYYRHSKGMGLN